jgi:hypothetical protein
VIGIAGGTIEGPDGAALTVPAYALKDKVECFVEPAGEGVSDTEKALTPVGDIFRFGPDSVQFQKNVTLRVPFDPARVPAGHKVSEVKVFMSGEGGTWQALATSPVAESAQTASAGSLKLAYAVAGLPL